MTTTRWQLLERLADGQTHSGEQLAAALGISRAAVWKHLQALRGETGLDITSISGRGYRLTEPLELLQAERLTAQIDVSRLPSIEDLALHRSVDSTNAVLLQGPAPGRQRARICIAEHQTAGRGRRGRTWQSPFGYNLYLSLAWRFDLGLSDLAALSLAVGVGLARALQRCGVTGHGLKWPNDLLLQERKLGGILVEAKGEVGGPATAVLGVGLNLRLPEAARARIDQPSIALADVGLGHLSRNQTAGIVLDELLATCHRYAHEGAESALREWPEFDHYRDRWVHLHLADQTLTGHYRGIDALGRLILEHAHGREHFFAGEVSLRPDSADA